MTLNDNQISAALGDFSKVATPGSGTYFQKGSYLARVEAIQFRDGYRGISFICELKVVKVIVGDENSNPEGSIASFVKNLTTGKDAAKTHIKGAAKAIAESMFGQTLADNAIDNQQLLAMAGPEQPFRDTYVYVNAFGTLNKNKEEITGVSFRPCFQRDLDQYGLQQPAPPA